ncbi:DNA alkylation repair protein [Myxococcota bacterium]|nr:DNA alkylation repair protein [Myxococcota bacterium]MBU1379513.1 DNA alkylation repair protein [Myxococcota bacterium]MBU1498187.1 DNA alkylation repair protein [Myxococcota bacterium]
MATSKEIIKLIKETGNATQAKLLQGYFKTGPGQYGEGDIFVGIKVPALRALAKPHRDMDLEIVSELLTSEIHEVRMFALFVLIAKFRKADEELQTQIFDVYTAHTDYINNWDLVDLSAGYIAGEFLRNRPKDILYEFARSNHLWKKRISIISTSAWIKTLDFTHTLAISEILLHDPHDLIQKAYGWMLREVGKKDMKTELDFLKIHYKTMPRTALRYAIEKFPEDLRQSFLKGKI